MECFIKFLLIIHFFCGFFYSAILQVQVSNGILEGTIHTTRKGRKINTFLAIPYAQPPVGELRFRDPVPSKPWKGVRMSDKDANMCPQLSLNILLGNEDCLYLNVYAPSLEFYPTKMLLPVMVWIHGGYFLKGSSKSTKYGPDYLLDKDIVYVSLNYRLGVLGFFSTGDLEAPGNFGLKDQVLALKWVQKNIKAFGGDPRKVTIFGQSAGGVNVGLHALSDASNGLFHQYIIQSGSPLASWGFRNRTEYKLFTKHFALIHFCPTFNSKVIVDCLRKKTLQELIDLRFSILYPITKLASFPWTPTNEPESEDAFLTDSPKNLIKKNRMKDLPFMSGNVGNEVQIFTEDLYSSEPFFYFTKLNWRSILDYILAYHHKPQYSPNLVEKIIDFYFNGSVSDIREEETKTRLQLSEISKFLIKPKNDLLIGYYPQPNIINKLEQIVNIYKNGRRVYLYSKEKFIQGASTFLNDAGFLYPQVKLLENRANISRNPFYFYIFNYKGIAPSLNYEVTNFTGVGHSEELYYLFPKKLKQLRNKGANEFVIDLMVDLWTSFAINGKPTSNLLYYPDIWRPYVENKSYLLIEGNSNNLQITSEHDVISQRFDFWENNAPIF